MRRAHAAARKASHGSATGHHLRIMSAVVMSPVALSMCPAHAHSMHHDSDTAASCELEVLPLWLTLRLHSSTWPSWID